MGKTLVTGATGLVGSHVARALVERGDDVRVTVRERSPRGAIEDLDVEAVVADVTDRRAMRRALKGVDRLFHVAGTTNLRAVWTDVYRANVQGTKVVLEEALAAGVQRAVHTSSVAAIGPAERGSTADEEQPFTAGRYGLPYVNAKHEAEKEALRVCALGLPLVIVNPAHVLGPGDLHRSSTEIVRRFLRREIPLYVDGAL
ncbi:MAG: NAD-dependent epimerase/dehydratase family protein, partial [Solirubrobacterales bacterium]|nr:NAD-dependent epimerase/dehydratase family protein [Solirubrobacterales bacterium]